MPSETALNTARNGVSLPQLQEYHCKKVGKENVYVSCYHEFNCKTSTFQPP